MYVCCVCVYMSSFLTSIPHSSQRPSIPPIHSTPRSLPPRGGTIRTILTRKTPTTPKWTRQGGKAFSGCPILHLATSVSSSCPPPAPTPSSSFTSPLPPLFLLFFLFLLSSSSSSSSSRPGQSQVLGEVLGERGHTVFDSTILGARFACACWIWV